MASCTCTYSSIHLSWRWQVENSCNLNSLQARRVCVCGRRGRGGCGHVHPCCPQQAYHSSSAPSKTKFACGQLFRLDRGEELAEMNTSCNNNLLLDLRHCNYPDQVRQAPVSKRHHESVVTRTSLARLPRRTCLGPALLTLLQRQQQAAVTLRQLGCQDLVSRQEPLRLSEIALHPIHLDTKVTLPVECHIDGRSRSGILLLRCNECRTLVL